MQYNCRMTWPLLLFVMVLWLATPRTLLAADFTVNTVNDTVDAAPGNGACADAGNQCSLRAAIMEANALSSDDAITLAGVTYTLTIGGRGEDAAATGDLDIIAGGLTIVGVGDIDNSISTVIHGGGLDRVFDLFKDSNVTFRRLRITGGDNQDALSSESAVGQGGGGVRAWEATLTLDEVRIESNRSANHGGGLSFAYNQFGRPKLTTLTINDSILTHNEAGVNGGALIIGRGAAAHISHTNVVSNTAKATGANGLNRYGGGGLYVGQGYTPIGGDLLNTTVYMTQTIFMDNFTSDRKNNQISGNAWGGALHLEVAVVSIDNSVFQGNAAEGNFGGAIYSDNARLTVNQSTFINNRVLQEGGAIATGSVLYTTIHDSTFTDNQAVASALGGGGAISGRGQESGGLFSISNSTFTDNSTAGSGGAVRTGSNSTIVNSEFTGNQAGSNGGAIVISRSSIGAPAIIKQVTVQGNRADVRGGGIHNGDVLYLSDSIIRNNMTVQGEGGGISNYQAYALTITNTDITSNSAKTNGGGLYDSHLTQGSNNIFPLTTRLTDVLIANNQAGGDGGGVFNISTIRIANSTISNNRATVSGGGLLTYSNFQFNSERTQFSVNLDLVNVTINGNQAAEGGAIYQNSGVSKLNNVTLTGNSASGTSGGGGIYYDKDVVGDAINPNTITLQNTILAQNSATFGPDCANTVLSAGNNLLGNNRDCTFSAASGDLVGTSATPLDPLLSSLADNGGATQTQALQTGSPAINAGNAATCATTDQREAARVGVCDIGAFEFGGTPKQAQSITFAKPADKTLADSPVTLTATASSNLPVSYSSSTPTVCTVSGATVTLVKIGLCTITASQTGDATYKAAPPVTQSFNVSAAPVKQEQTITFDQPANKTLGDAPFVLNATASSELTVSFASDTPTICTVSGATVTLVAVGACTITASQAGNAAFHAAQPVTRSFQVNASAENRAKSLFMPLVRKR